MGTESFPYLGGKNEDEEAVATAQVHKGDLSALPEAGEVGGNAQVLVDALLRVTGLLPVGDEVRRVLLLQPRILAEKI